MQELCLNALFLVRVREPPSGEFLRDSVCGEEIASSAQPLNWMQLDSALDQMNPCGTVPHPYLNMYYKAGNILSDPIIL